MKILRRTDWIRLLLASFKLYNYDIVQLFQRCHFLGSKGRSEVLRTDYSFGYTHVKGIEINPAKYDKHYPHPGYGYAMKKSLWDQTDGLLDRAIVGNADVHMAFAAVGRVSETVPKDVDVSYHSYVQQWESKLLKGMTGKRLGFLPIIMYHNWHGSRKNRGYVDRWKIIQKNNFDPYRDVHIDPQSKLLVWNHDSSNDVRLMEKEILEYFTSRYEDDDKEYSADHLTEKKPLLATTSEGFY